MPDHVYAVLLTLALKPDSTAPCVLFVLAALCTLDAIIGWGCSLV